MQRSISNTLITIAVCLLAIKEFWLLLGIPSFSNAVISFLTVGAVPGTSHTLSPAQIYWMVGVIFVFVVLAAFRKNIAGLFTVRRDRRVYKQAHITPIPHPYDPIAIIAPVEHQSDIRKRSRWLWQFDALAFATRATKIATQISRVATKQLSRSVRWTKRLVILFWYEVEPYIRMFDAWLEKKLHQYEHTATLLSIGSEMSSTVQKMAKNVKDIATDAHQSAASEQKQS